MTRATALTGAVGPHLPCLCLVCLHQLPRVLVLGHGFLQLSRAGVVAANVPAVGGGVAELSGETKGHGGHQLYTDHDTLSQITWPQALYGDLLKVVPSPRGL